MAKPPVRERRRLMDLGERPTGAVQRTRRRRTQESEHVLALRSYEAHQLDDPFKGIYTAISGNSLTILQPTYNLNSLVRLPKENNILQQCIDAMVTNCAGHGHRLNYIGPEDQEESAEALAEAERLKGLLEYPNDEYSMQELLERMKRDKETIGASYMEVGRDEAGFPCMLAHVPGHTLRKTTKESEDVEVEVELPRNGKVEKIKIKKRFRRYVQIIGNRRVYFKEFGDPRKIDPENGDVDDTMSLEDSANEIIVDEIYSPGEAYALPRWIGQMPAILGSRQAELTNLDFFKENAIPAAALLVSGGVVTQGSLDAIEEHFTALRGRAAMNRILVIETEGTAEAADATGKVPAPRVDLKPLANERQQDGLFQTYDENNVVRVRSSFRLPAVFTGHSSDYTYATAKTSFEVAESQVFGPERNKTNEIINKRILAPFQPKFWEFRLQPPRITDPEEVINAWEALDKMGAMTPNQAIDMANEYFDLDINQIEGEWGNYPFEIVKAMAASGELKGVEDIHEPKPEPVVQPGAFGKPAAGDGTAAATNDNDKAAAAAARRHEIIEGLRALATAVRVEP